MKRLGNKKAASSLRWSGFSKKRGALYAVAVFLAGNFSLIRADLPLRSRR
jgi:hypothetical protein